LPPKFDAAPALTPALAFLRIVDPTLRRDDDQLLWSATQPGLIDRSEATKSDRGETMCILRVASAFLLLVLAQIATGAVAAEPTAPELRTAQELERVRTDPLSLRAFLKRMPKGADLHNHLDGAVYAETFIRVGGEDGLCVDQAAKAFTKSQPVDAGAEPQPVCEAGDVAAADVPKNQHLYDALVDSFSMRGFVPSESVTGHDHFFATFAKFGGTDPRHTGDFLDEVATRAAA
jgi:adenosine deaminase